MNRDPIPSKQFLVISHVVGCGFACIALLLCFSRATIGQTPNEAQGAAAGSVVHVTHLLGLEDVRNNTKGQLRIQDDALQFQRDGSTAAQVSISSIQGISLGTEDKQIGGVPMTLGKAAVPFEGGRAISLFSHKKYDTLTVEYLDNNGGFHGAIFQMNRGQGEGFEKDLAAKGVHIASPEVRARKQSAPEGKATEVKQ
jgi:NO-binding membrane sensor protein with MHYT domain